MILNKTKLHRLTTKVTIFLLSLFIGNLGYAQCSAGFTFDDTTGCTTVSFTNTSTPPGNLTYSWDFGDGSPLLTLENPTHSFPDPDPSQSVTYPVKLVITHTNGCKDSITQNVIIFQVPDADFTATFVSCREVGFVNNTQNNPDFTYLWDFGDGSPTSTQRTPANHTYSSVAVATNYTITLTVENPNGCISIDTKTITILPNIVADFTFSPDSSCSPASVSFDATNSVGAQTYVWDFDDGGGTTTHLLMRLVTQEICLMSI